MLRCLYGIALERGKAIRSLLLMEITSILKEVGNNSLFIKLEHWYFYILLFKFTIGGNYYGIKNKIGLVFAKGFIFF